MKSGGRKAQNLCSGALNIQTQALYVVFSTAKVFEYLKVKTAE